MKKEEQPFRAELLQQSITYCMQEQCPQSSYCLHYLAYKHSETFYIAEFFDPRKIENEKKCPEFLDNTVHLFARGFKQALEQTPKGKVASLRREICTLFHWSRDTYYRFARGERMLSPLQQEQLVPIFSRHGIDKDDVFDHYEESYNQD